MASANRSHRAVAAGISGGLGVALPLAAYAVTGQVGAVDGALRADLIPLAAGAALGVGFMALSGCLLDRHAERVAAEEADAAAFASVFQGAEAAAAPGRDALHRRAHAARQATPKGVPVIARAVDALDEAEAWAEIDAIFSEDSPISCDPARSKDIYEIAFAELRRSAQAQAAGAAAEVAADAGATGAVSTAGSVGVDAAPATTMAAVPETTAAARAPQADAEDDAARDAAMTALYGAAAGAAVPGAPAQPSVPVSPVAAAAATDDGIPAEPGVAVADYSGHEDMWASALAILADEPVSGLAVPAAAPEEPSVLSETVVVAPARMAAVAEGGEATRRHSEVNAILEEEFDKVDSRSVRRTSHEFLRVIQGGTASLPRLQQAEA